MSVGCPKTWIHNLMFTIDFNTISFILAIISILIGFLAVWQSKQYKEESEQLNEKTRLMLEDIKVHSTVISQYAIPELRAYGESFRKLMYEEKTSKTTGMLSTPHQALNASEQKNISNDLLEEINFLTKHTGKAISMEVFDRLKHKYNFGTILQELFIMQRNGRLSWPEAPNSPEALSELKIVQE